MEIKAGEFSEKYLLKLQKEVSYFIFRSISGENKLTFSAPFKLDAAIISTGRRRRPLSVKLLELIDEARRRRLSYWPNIHTLNGVELREITAGNFMPEALSQTERSIFHRLRYNESDILFLGQEIQKLQASSNILRDILDWLHDPNGEEFAFFVNGREFSHTNNSAIQYYLQQRFGDGSTGSGPAWSFMTANPTIGMISFGASETNHVSKFSSGNSKRLLQLMNIDVADIKSSSGFPTACLIRKSALAWILSTNIEYQDIASGLYDADTLLHLIPALICRAGFGITPIPLLQDEAGLGHSVMIARWVQHRPFQCPAGSNVCLFVGLLGKDGQFAPHALAYMRGLKEQNLFVYALGVSLSIPESARDPGEDFCNAFAARQNDGHDFAIWAAAIKRHPELWDAETLLFANDSMIPAQASFDDLFDKISLSPYDVTGLTDSTISHHHLQSYFIHLKKNALKSTQVRKFWNSVLSWADKSRIINLYEIGMTSKFSAAGLRCGPLYTLPAAGGIGRRNPSIYCWRELIKLGLPFVKTQVIKDAIASGTLHEVINFLKQNGFDAETFPGTKSVGGQSQRNMHTILPEK
ncbi:hypothetical protein OK142_15690 [Agrobacterium sp. BT-220-3]|nr:hypothetical protein [Agrobacterium sp. BT-220-3]